MALTRRPTGAQPTRHLRGGSTSRSSAPRTRRAWPPPAGPASEHGRARALPRGVRSGTGRAARCRPAFYTIPREPGAGAAAVGRPRPGDAAAPCRARGQGAARPEARAAVVVANNGHNVTSDRVHARRGVPLRQRRDRSRGAGHGHWPRRQGASPARAPAPLLPALRRARHQRPEPARRPAAAPGERAGQWPPPGPPPPRILDDRAWTTCTSSSRAAAAARRPHASPPSMA